MTQRQALNIDETPGAPIACDMTTAQDTPEERFAEYARLYAHALVDRKRTADAVELIFSAKPGVLEWTADIARREWACCPFSSHQVTLDGERVVWRMSSQAGPAAQAILDEVYALPERVPGGLDGLLARLADRGLPIKSAEPGRFTIDEAKAAPGLLGRVKAACGC